jgi:uncharacterized protein (TIGR03083 family)
MSTDTKLESYLTSIREISDALAEYIVTLSVGQWDAPTNCGPWKVHDLSAHVVNGAEGFITSIRQGLAGSAEPILASEDVRRRQADVAAADPRTVANALRTVTAEFLSLYEGLQQDELSAICFHRRGNRSVRWYAAHRLAEVAFHSWDLHFSLGQEQQLEEHVAAMLLPTLLESNAPRTYAAGLSDQRGTGERYRLVVENDPLSQWTVTIDPEALRVQRGATTSDLVITGSAASLALLTYGRADLRTLSQAGALRVDGDIQLADRFSAIFPRP